MVVRHNKQETIMGLDMYAYTLPKDDARPPVDFEIDDIPDWERRNLHYWRKHPNLHGWMNRLYWLKGGTDPNFNCNTLAITADDLDALERVVMANQLPETTGFFFGVTRSEERDEDLEFIRKAREEIAQGRTIAYYAWW